MAKIDPTPRVSCKYGAPMGRLSRTPDNIVPGDRPLYLRRVPLDIEGYDSGGTYWGLGEPLYWCGNDSGEINYFFRARSRNAAKALVWDEYPNARFFR